VWLMLCFLNNGKKTSKAFLWHMVELY